MLHLIDSLLFLSIFSLYALATGKSTKTQDDLGTRIILGSETSIDKHYYLLSLLKKRDMPRVEFTLRGSAFIIAEHWAMTAAHALYMDGKRQLMDRLELIVVGGINYTSDMYGYSHRILYRVVHPQFSRDSLEAGYDIGLIKVKDPFYFTIERQVKLAGRNYQYLIGDPVQIMGWGLVDPMGTFRYWDNKLFEVNLFVLPDERCSDYGKYPSVHESLFCAGVQVPKRTASKDSCTGDSGGPAVNGDVAIGIISYGNGHGDEVCGKYGVYTKIGYFEDWITDKIRKVDGYESVNQLIFVDNS